MVLDNFQEKHLKAQGFVNLDDPSQATWLKFSALMCATGFGIGTYLQSPATLFAMGLIAVSGIAFRRTIFDIFYNQIIARILSNPDLPERPAPARFACFIGVIWSSITATAFLVNATTLGLILGAILTFVALLMGTINYCVASEIWKKVFGTNETETSIKNEDNEENIEEDAKKLFDEYYETIGKAAVGIARQSDAAKIEDDKLVEFNGGKDELEAFVENYQEVIGSVATRIAKKKTSYNAD